VEIIFLHHQKQIPTHPIGEDSPLIFSEIVNGCLSTRIVIILDCCYSGAAIIGSGKGGRNEDEAAKLGRGAIENKFMEGEGIYLLASSQAAQKSFPMPDKPFSAFSYFLLDGLRGREESVESNGYVTPESLGKYIDTKILELQKRQKPVRKAQASGDIILAHYPRFATKSRLVDPSITINSASLTNEGNRYFMNGEYDKAIELYEKVISDPNFVKSWYNKGVILVKSSRYAEAIKCFEKVLAIDPNDANAQYTRGRLLSLLGKHTEAIKCFEKVLAIDPDDANAQYDKGVSLGKLNRHEEAIKCFEKVLAIDPNDAKIWYDKGIAYGMLESRDKAKECFEKVLAIDPNDANAQYYKKLFS
jgi:tetratricopeptide (TPR) repeat protein